MMFDNIRIRVLFVMLEFSTSSSNPSVMTSAEKEDPAGRLVVEGSDWRSGIMVKWLLYLSRMDAIPLQLTCRLRLLKRES